VKVKMKNIVITAMALAPIVHFLRTFSASPLPQPQPFTGSLPSATPPPAMAVFALPTGVTHRVAAAAYRGGSFFAKRNFSMTAALVKHPNGDLLIDTGFGRNIAEQFLTMPFMFRMLTRYTAWQTAADQLMAAGYDQKDLRAIILTHAHWDHVSGLPDFPDVPVWVTTPERNFIRKGGNGQFGEPFPECGTRAKTDSSVMLPCVHYEEYEFEGGPYLGFSRSHDVYGDGAIVVVPSPGHTPGSVIIFLTLPKGTRYAFVGDLVWQREGITLREERPWLIRHWADLYPEGTRENLLHIAAIKARFPELIIVPAHDSRGFAEMPALSQATLSQASS
jgi:glyoxylase-like metal-dependent hydrolase (beta-lactamase superfamily II)